MRARIASRSGLFRVRNASAVLPVFEVLRGLEETLLKITAANLRVYGACRVSEDRKQDGIDEHRQGGQVVYSHLSLEQSPSAQRGP